MTITRPFPNRSTTIERLLHTSADARQTVKRYRAQLETHLMVSLSQGLGAQLVPDGVVRQLVRRVHGYLDVAAGQRQAELRLHKQTKKNGHNKRV